MKLESLKLDKFNEGALKREQMFTLNGGGTKTPGGHGCGGGTVSSDMGSCYDYDYGYDINQNDGRTTYHDRTNVQKISFADCRSQQGN